MPRSWRRISRKRVILIAVLAGLGLYYCYVLIQVIRITYDVATLQYRMREQIYPGAVMDRMPEDLRSRVRQLPENQLLEHIQSLMEVDEKVYVIEKGHMIYYFTAEQSSNTQVLEKVYEIRS